MPARRIARWMTDTRDPRSLGSRLRARRSVLLGRLIRSLHAEHGRVDVIDVGGAASYWRVFSETFLEAHGVRVTLVGPELGGEGDGAGRFRSVRGDGCDLRAFGPDAFHIAHANSVIEHVGDWERMVRFASELRRVGVVHYVQTPNFWFPIEPHYVAPFVHWLPEPLRIRLVRTFAIGHFPRANSVDQAVRAVESARLLDSTMMRALFPDSVLHTEWFLGFPKSFTAVGPCAGTASPSTGDARARTRTA